MRMHLISFFVETQHFHSDTSCYPTLTLALSLRESGSLGGFSPIKGEAKSYSWSSIKDA